MVAGSVGVDHARLDERDRPRQEWKTVTPEKLGRDGFGGRARKVTGKGLLIFRQNALRPYAKN